MNQPIFSYYSNGELWYQMALLFVQLTVLAVIAAGIAYAILTGVDKLKNRKPKPTLWDLFDRMQAEKSANKE